MASVHALSGAPLTSTPVLPRASLTSAPVLPSAPLYTASNIMEAGANIVYTTSNII